MPRPTSSNTDKAWAELFSSAIQRPKLPQGEGWLTFPEIRAKFGTGDRRARTVVQSLRQEGRLECFEGLQMIGNKAKRQVWYRPTGLDRPKGAKTR